MLHNSAWQAIFKKGLKFGSPPQPCVLVLIVKSKLELSRYQPLHLRICIYLVSHNTTSCFYLPKGGGLCDEACVCMLCDVWVSGSHLLQGWSCQNIDWSTHIRLFHILLWCHTTSTPSHSVVLEYGRVPIRDGGGGHRGLRCPLLAGDLQI